MDNVKITSLTLRNYSCFRKAEIDFMGNNDTVHQWTVLMGNNNTGKTSILKAIAQLSPKVFKTPSLNKANAKNRFVPAIFYDKSFQETALRNGTSVHAKLSIKDLPWGFTNNEIKISSQPLEDNMLIFGYGVSRYPSSTSLSENRARPCDTLFSSDSRLVNLEEWLMQLDYAAKNDQSIAESRLSRIHELICGNLFPEIKDFTFQSSDELHNYVLFTTNDGAFRYTQLGYGYQSMLSWIVDLCKRMFDAYPNSPNPLHEGAIVLVDEIDLHLHPRWQRDIIPYLSEAFPNVQFIVTTHSPLVVQSVKEINLYILRRDEQDVHVTKTRQQNFRGWTVEEILRDTMELDSDIHSDEYQTLIAQFNHGLDNADKEAVDTAYDKLLKIIHPSNPIRRLLELQKNTMP